MENLEGEINITHRYHHKNILELYDVIKTEKSFHLVLEHCHGGDLHRFLKKHERLSEATTRHFMRQLASGLLFLRGNGLMHRDLKPQNLLLSSDSLDATLKIADFGFARVLTEATMTDTLCGSPQYMAPEIMQGRRYDAKADLWSVGMILYECVVGRTPYMGRSQIELLRNIMARPLTMPSSLDVSSECKSIIKMLLKAGPELRCSYEEFFSHKWIGLKPAFQQQQQDELSPRRSIGRLSRLRSLPEEAMRRKIVHPRGATSRKFSEDGRVAKEFKECNENSVPPAQRLSPPNKSSLAHQKFNAAPLPSRRFSSGGTTSPLQQSGSSLQKYPSLDRGQSSASSSSSNSTERKFGFAVEGAINNPPTPFLLKFGSSKQNSRGRGLSNIHHYEFKPLITSPPRAEMNEIVVANMIPPLNLDAYVQADGCNDDGNHMQQNTLDSGIEDYVIVDKYLGTSPQASTSKSPKLPTQGGGSSNAHRYGKMTAAVTHRAAQNELPRVNGARHSPKDSTTGSGGNYYHSSPQQLAASVVSDLENVEKVGKRAVVLAQLGDANVVAALEILHAGYITDHVEATLLNGVYCSLNNHNDVGTKDNDDDPQVLGGQHSHASSCAKILKDSKDIILPSLLDACFGLDLYNPITRNAGFRFGHHEKENECPVFTSSSSRGWVSAGSSPRKPSCAVAYECSDDVSQAASKLLADAYVLYLKSLEMIKAMVILARKGIGALEAGKEVLFSQTDWSHHEQITAWGEGLLHWLSLQFIAVLDRAEQCQTKLRSHGGELSSSTIARSMKSIDYLIVRGAVYMGKEAILLEALGQSKKATKQLKNACLLLETLTFGGSGNNETLASSRGGSNREKGGFCTLARELIHLFQKKSRKKPTIIVPAAV